MKRITKESLGTAFQITAIIFIFSYSSSPVTSGEQLNTVDKTKTSAPYSAKIQHRTDSINASNLYYSEKKKPGFFYNNLSSINIQGSKK
jgi:hypothetical protein